MKIRTITVMYDPTLSNANETLGKLDKLIEKGKQIYSQSGYEVQTVRLSTTPFSSSLNTAQVDTCIEKIKSWEKTCKEHSYDYWSFGPALPEVPQSYEIIPALLKETENAFFSAVIADDQGIHLSGVKASAEIIQQAATITPDGFTNLRFTTLANVKPFGPFFPGSWMIGKSPAFALAIESADLAINAFENAESVSEARSKLLDSLHKHSHQLNEISKELEQTFGIEFKGMDFSLAPFPTDDCSLGGAIEKLGINKLGYCGSLAAAAIVAETLDQGKWLKAGYNGLMLPVLEDSILAQRTIDGTLSIKDLLLYSTLCGTGLDTVPLPGNVRADQIAGLLADIATLSIRLDKPLTGRLMPVPEKEAGEMTEYDFEFFKNGRILELPSEPLFGPLAGNETFNLQPKYKFNC